MANPSSTAPKATIAYRVISGKNPKKQNILRPLIVNKETYDTSRVLHYAIDNGYVVGTQFFAGYGIVNGFLEACQALGKDGRDILLNSWLRIHPELRGTCDPETRMINEDNELHVCVQAQADLRRKASEFLWMCVDDNAVRPTVQHLQSEGGERDKEIWASARIIVGGTNLKYTASTDKVTAGWNTVDASTGVITPHEAVLVPESSGASNMVLPFPTGLATAPVGTAVTFTFVLKQGVENAAVLPAVCKATLVENPVLPPVGIAKIVDADHLGSTTDYIGKDIRGVHLEGRNLGLEGYVLSGESRDVDGHWTALWDLEVTEATNDSIDFMSPQPASMIGSRAWRFTVTNSMGTATRSVEITGW